MKDNNHNTSDEFLEVILWETKDQTTIRWGDDPLDNDLRTFQKKAASEPLNKGGESGCGPGPE